MPGCRELEAFAGLLDYVFTEACEFAIADHVTGVGCRAIILEVGSQPLVDFATIFVVPVVLVSQQSPRSMLGAALPLHPCDAEITLSH
ncbi:hypothetical protein A5738_22570 [Mycobacterium colombiense]|nr:hypothetical protein A5738_22570 [Mycobacterium colombiense]